MHIHYCAIIRQYVYINDAARILMCDEDLGKMDCMHIDPDIYTNESCLFISAREPSTLLHGMSTSREFQICFQEIAGMLRKLKMELKQPIEKMEEKGIAKEDILRVTICQEKELEEHKKKLIAAVIKLIGGWV